MGEYRTVNETARLWGVKTSQVTRYCRQGRIEGAIKRNGSWLIPQQAQKPEWGKKSVAGVNQSGAAPRRPLPVGVSSYKDACSNYYYIDKTMMIRDFLDERPKVALFTRPRRFGKTLTMDMLRTFFELTDEDTSVYFQDKLIWQQGAAYQAAQGRYPVVYLSFKDAKKNNWAQTLEHIAQLITSEYRRHGALKTSPRILNRDYYERIVDGTADRNQLDTSLRELTQMLHEHYGVAPVVMIDEYDTPIQQGYAKGFYEDTVDFMRNLFSGAFKDNDHLTYGFLTGILRVAKESIFSGLNNLKIYSVLDNSFSQYFGFTEDEVRQMAQYYRAEDALPELCDWYDGYRFGETEIFNPWSVINYFSNDCKPSPFWENTGSNTIIGDILEQAGEEIYDQLNAMLQGEEITTLIDTNVIYPEIRKNPSTIYSFLLVAGYLKLAKVAMSPGGDFIGRVSLPNREIAYVYKKEVLGKLSRFVPQAVSVSLQEALYLGDAGALQKHIHRFLLESVSSFDLVNENAYHMLVLGLCAILRDKYELRSNRESGAGRFDIQLMPKGPVLPGILIEIKHRKDCQPEQLNELAAEGISQINRKQYDAELRSRGVKTAVKYGVAFSGKNVAIVKE
ncbi:MAG: AAA family ATPase [Ruminiclostridium sp.]|nr:AAA family ATPase [Ruminiclostridium sp.]